MRRGVGEVVEREGRVEEGGGWDGVSEVLLVW